MPSTHFTCGYIWRWAWRWHGQSDSEGRKVLFNDALNTFYVRLYMALGMWYTANQIAKEGSVLFNDALNTFYVRLYMALGMWYTANQIAKEGSVLFNDALNTFYLRIYGVGHMLKYHSDSERGMPLPPLHGLLFFG